ncbi:GGDEF domain-containing protein [Novosphingobium sp. P6W]|uniref:GGDEF domain-containing protein n=1 Tax=Novosphingobium sp. P6W TaxID=1609758 RepID=UPI001F05FF64|nr:GGDEF domain-containing protein [Novosphingobium sp. P6W]
MKFQIAGNHSEDTAAGRQVDIVALGIVTAAIILFVATGSEIGPAVVRSLRGEGPGPDSFMLDAFLLNIAIIIFGWSRYRQLCEEIAAGKAAENAARRLAETDALTGFLNRRSFNAGIDALIAQGADPGVNNGADQHRATALMMIDLDNFKQVNDHNGHSVGDLLLCECARRIAAALPHGALVGRIGGDEFAVALPFDRQRPEFVDHIAKVLVASIGESVRINAVNIAVSASIGLSRSDLGGDEPAGRVSSLFEMADIAMYHSKRQGRNGFSWFEAHMADEMRFRSELENGIRQGIPRGEFVPFYEQQIDLQTGELIGFEMLARWDSPQFGIVAPDICSSPSPRISAPSRNCRKA